MAPRWEYLLICGLPAAEVAYTNKDSVTYAVDIGPVAPRAVNRWEAGLLLRLVSEKIVPGTWYLVLGTRERAQNTEHRLEIRRNRVQLHV